MKAECIIKLGLIGVGAYLLFKHFNQSAAPQSGGATPGSQSVPIPQGPTSVPLSSMRNTYGWASWPRPYAPYGNRLVNPVRETTYASKMIA